jgi:taurine dioxygenase
MLTVTPSEQACGAIVEGVDLSKTLTLSDLQAIQAAWWQHHVLSFPNQNLSDADLERVTQSLGRFGEEPFFEPIEGHQHICAVSRRADEQAPLFAEAWHTDWSFLSQPPIGTCLYGITIPPKGGDTSFINQHKALQAMPIDLRARTEHLIALHSAVLAYSPEGVYGANDSEDRSMQIVYSEKAKEIRPHPLVQIHPESGQAMLFGCLGYIIGIEGMPDDQATELLTELYEWQTREEFQYHHQWHQNTFLLWDNRSVLHRANGGYDGYDRLLHRTTIYSQ